jgi:hypothetical protein
VGRVVDLERERVEVLAHQLLPVLRERGSVIANTFDLDDIERWRRAARRAGRMLGWRVRTGLLANGARVWATSEDWPIPPGAGKEAAEQVDELVARSRSEQPGRHRRPHSRR